VTAALASKRLNSVNNNIINNKNNKNNNNNIIYLTYILWAWFSLFPFWFVTYSVGYSLSCIQHRAASYYQTAAHC
jgi:hypothetical protein